MKSVKSGVALLLLCTLLLVATYLANRHRHTTPTAVTPTASPVATEPTIAKQPPAQQTAPLQLSIDQQLEFAPPPDLFSHDDPVMPDIEHSELFDTLAKPHGEEDAYSLSGKVMLEEEPDYTLKSIEGLQLEVKIKTD